jgi:hypothetical protein
VQRARHLALPWALAHCPVGQDPDGVAIDLRTDTVYVANVLADGDSGAGSVSVINGATCDAQQHVGCGQVVATIPVGYVPALIFADPANDTLCVPVPPVRLAGRAGAIRARLQRRWTRRAGHLQLN